MDKMLQGLDGVMPQFDDILISSRDVETHHQSILEVFRRQRQCNLRARIEKCSFFQPQLRFPGILIDKDGLRPNPEKTVAIRDMPVPTNVIELRSFLGAVAFYMKFVKDMSTIREPLDHLLRKDVRFEWTKECQKAVERFKDILCSPLLLTHFNPEPISVAADDASQAGIGCCIYHVYPDGQIKALYHASRRLTPTEQRYSQIEKEALAIVFAVTKFHKYLFGREFMLYTDHRPLLHIFGTELGIPPHTANRLQRWAHRFDISYIGTNEFGHADVLSRLISERSRSDEDLVIANIQLEETRMASIFVDDMDKNLPIKFMEIASATQKDFVFKHVVFP